MASQYDDEFGPPEEQPASSAYDEFGPPEPPQPADLPTVGMVNEDQENNTLRELAEFARKAPPNYDMVREIADKTGAYFDDVMKGYEPFKQAAQRQDFDPAKWKAENPVLANYLRKRPLGAPTVIRAEPMGSPLRAVTSINNWQANSSWYERGLMAVMSGPFALTPAYANPFMHLRRMLPEGVGGIGDAPAEMVEGVDRPGVGLLDAAGETAARSLQQVKVSVLSMRAGFKEARADLARAMDSPDADELEASALSARGDLLRAEEAVGPRQFYDVGGAGQTFLDAVEGVGSTASVFAGAGVGGVVGGVAAPLATRGRASFQAGAQVGAAATSFASSFVLSYGGAMRELESLTGEDGTKLSSIEKHGLAALSAVLESGLETVSVMGAGGAPLRRALTQRAFTAADRALYGKVGKELLEAYISEGATGALQQVVSIARQYAGESVVTGKAPDLNLSEVINDVTKAAYFEAAGAGLFGAVGSAAQVGAAAGRSARAKLFTQRVEQEAMVAGIQQGQQLAKLVDMDSTRAAGTELVEALQEEAEKSGVPVNVVRVSPRHLVEALREKDTLALQEVEKQLGQRLPEALTRQGEGSLATLEMTPKEFFEIFGKYKIGAKLADHVTTGSVGETLTTVVETTKGEQKKIDARAKELVAAVQGMEDVDGGWFLTTDEGRAEVDRLEGLLEQTIDDADEREAVLTKHMATLENVSQRLGVPVAELVEQSKIEVQRETEAERLKREDEVLASIGIPDSEYARHLKESGALVTFSHRDMRNSYVVPGGLEAQRVALGLPEVVDASKPARKLTTASPAEFSMPMGEGGPAGVQEALSAYSESVGQSLVTASSSTSDTGVFVPPQTRLSAEAEVAMADPTSDVADALASSMVKGVEDTGRANEIKAAKAALSKVNEAKPKVPPTIAGLFSLILPDTGVLDYGKADARYRTWIEGGRKGPRPKAWEGGELDAINGWLHLRGKARVSSALEGFSRMLGRSRDWRSVARVVEIFKNEVPGFEKAALPEHIQEWMWSLDEAEKALEAAQGPQTLQQPDQQNDARGWVKINRDGVKAAYKIVLSKKADASTVLHELSHVYFDIIFRAMQGPGFAGMNPTDQMRADWVTLAERLDIGDQQTELTEEQQEKFAKLYEAYFMEGKAPSVALANIFAAFSAWLHRIYGHISALGVSIDPEIRGIFDRILATDQEIQRVQDAANVNFPYFRSANAANMTEQEYTNYLRERASSRTRAALSAKAKLAKARQSAFGREWQKAVDSFKPAAEEVYRALPVVRLWELLRNGRTTDEKGRVTAQDKKAFGLLDIAAVQKIVGRKHPIIEKLSGRLVRDGGLDPAQVALDNGFSSAKEMLEVLATLPSREDWVRTEAEKAAEAKYGNLRKLYEEARALAMDALHEEGTTSALSQEYKLWQKVRGRKTFPSEAALKWRAQVRVSTTNIQRLSLSALHREENQHLQQSQHWADTGRLVRADEEFANAMVAHYAYEFMSKAISDRKYVLDTIRRLQRQEWQEKLGQASTTLPPVVNAIADSLGLGRQTTTGTPFDIEEAVRRARAANVEIGFDDLPMRKIADGLGKSWKNLDAGGLGVYRAALEALTFHANNALTVKLEGKERVISQILDDIETDTGTVDMGDIAASTSVTDPDAQARPATPAGRVRGFAAQMRDPGAIIAKLGPKLFDIVWRKGLNRARLKNRELIDSVAKDWDAITNAYYASDAGKRRYEVLTDLDGVETTKPVGKVRDRVWMLMVALNMGNASNRQRLLAGYGWEFDKVRDWLERNMTPEEAKFVQSVWDLLDQKLWPEVSGVYSRVKGVPPPKIEAAELDLGSLGTLRGGYFPVHYDPLLRSPINREQALDTWGGASDVHAGVNASMTKARADTMFDPLNLDWSTFPAHLAATIHYVSHEEFVKDTNKIFTHERFKELSNRKLGAAYYSQLEGWLKSVASHTYDSVPIHLTPAAAFVDKARSRYIQSVMAYAIQITMGDLPNAMVAFMRGNGVTLRHQAAAYMYVLNKFRSTAGRAEILGRFTEAKLRRRHAKSDLGEDVARIGAAGKGFWNHPKLKEAEKFAMVLTETMDAFNTAWVAQAGYLAGRDAGMSIEDAQVHGSETVQRILTSHEPALQSGILRDKHRMGMLLAFYGWANKEYNVLLDIAEDKGMSRWEAAGRIIGVLVIQNVMSELMSGRGPDEGEEPEEWVLRKMIAAPFAMLPFMAGIGDVLAGGVTSKLFHGEAMLRQVSTRSSPGVAYFELLVNRALRYDFEEDPEKFIAAVLQGAGLVAGSATLSSMHLQRILAYALDYGLDDLENERVLRLMSGVAHGEREDQPKNIFTIAEDVLQ